MCKCACVDVSGGEAASHTSMPVRVCPHSRQVSYPPIGHNTKLFGYERYAIWLCSCCTLKLQNPGVDSGQSVCREVHHLGG